MATLTARAALGQSATLTARVTLKRARSQDNEPVAPRPAKSSPLIGWCLADKDPEVDLEYDHLCKFYPVAQCKSTPSQAWRGVRGRPGIISGRYMFEVKVIGEKDLVRVGWSSADAPRAVGSDTESFGYGGTGKRSTGGKFADYGPEFAAGDVVGCLINREQHFIAFTLNGKELGKAFNIPRSLDGVALYPAVCAREAFKVAGYFGHAHNKSAGLPFGLRGFWPVAVATEEDRAEDDPETVLASAPEEMLPSVDEAKARGVRAMRFRGMASSNPELTKGTGLFDRDESEKPDKPTVTIPDSLVEKASTTDAKPLVGVSEDLERRYVRSTALPRAEDVRPVRVLRKAMALLEVRWKKDRDWVHAGEMLRSIRQDLTVQMIRSGFTIEVYEFCARAALEVGDFKQFGECSSQLEELHSDPALCAAGATKNAPEFLAYRLLYLSLQGDGGLALSTFMMRCGAAIRKAVAAGDPHVAPAWKLRCRLAAGAVPAAGLNGHGLKAPQALQRLISMLLAKAQLKKLAAVCRAYKSVSKSLLDRMGLLPKPGAGALGQEDEELPIRFDPKNADMVDTAATINEAERRLISGSGQKVRLGKQSTDHARDFVRAVPQFR